MTPDKTGTATLTLLPPIDLVAPKVFLTASFAFG